MRAWQHSIPTTGLACWDKVGFNTALSNVYQIELRVEVTGMIMAEASIDNIRLVPPHPPFIVQQPEAFVVVPVGSNTRHFTVIAGGDEPLEYQWQFEGVDISGETLPWSFALYMTFSPPMLATIAWWSPMYGAV